MQVFQVIMELLKFVVSIGTLSLAAYAVFNALRAYRAQSQLLAIAFEKNSREQKDYQRNRRRDSPIFELAPKLDVYWFWYHCGFNADGEPGGGGSGLDIDCWMLPRKFEGGQVEKREAFEKGGHFRLILENKKPAETPRVQRVDLDSRSEGVTKLELNRIIAVSPTRPENKRESENLELWALSYWAPAVAYANKWKLQIAIRFETDSGNIDRHVYETIAGEAFIQRIDPPGIETLEISPKQD